MSIPYMVGLTGGSASGKTLFLRRLLASFSPGQVCLVSQDNYYRPREEQPIDPNGVHNFDRPESIDFDAFYQDLSALHRGEVVQRLEYTFNNPLIEPATLTFEPNPIIVVEGIFVFYKKEIADLLDLKLFIDAQEHIKLVRRITRDRIERGYDLDDVLYRYQHHVAPTYERYIKPYRDEADIIIPNNRHFDKALEVVNSFLHTKLPQPTQA